MARPRRPFIYLGSEGWAFLGLAALFGWTLSIGVLRAVRPGLEGALGAVGSGLTTLIGMVVVTTVMTVGLKPSMTRSNWVTVAFTAGWAVVIPLGLIGPLNAAANQLVLLTSAAGVDVHWIITRVLVYTIASLISEAAFMLIWPRLFPRR